MTTPTTTRQDNIRSRLPDPNQFFAEVAAISEAMFKATRNGSIPQTTISLVQLRAGQIVGNTYHTIRQTGDLRKAGETEECGSPRIVECSLCRFRDGSGCGLVVDGAHHVGRAVSAIVVVEAVAPVQHDGLGSAGVCEVVSG